MNQAEIKILKIIRLQGAGVLRGFVDIGMGSWIINDWRVLQRPGEPIQVSYPLVSYRDKSGIHRYRSLLSVPSQLKQYIELQILLAWKQGDQDAARNKSTN